MCEMCRLKEQYKAGDVVPAELLGKMKEQLKKWADDVVDTTGLDQVTEGRQAQENEAMQEACGLTLRRVWEIYAQMAKGEAITLTPEEARGFSRWITILARSRFELTKRLQDAMETLNLAAIVEQMRQQEEGQSEANAKLPMVDLGYGLAGSGKGGPKRDN